MTDEGGTIARSQIDLLGLEGRVAVVTGGGGNIGSATVRMLGQVGANVLVADVDRERAERSANASRALGADVVAVQADVTRREDIERMVGSALNRWERIDIGVNVVGGGGGAGKSSLELPEEEWRASIERNLFTAVWCSQAYARTMIDTHVAGSIVNIASPAGLRAAPTMVAYGASKAALINFTWTLAVELAPYGIRANVVVPAFVPNPDITWGGNPDEQAALAKRTVPMGRVTLADDVAGAHCVRLATHQLLDRPDDRV
jgi:3-oxoacyl-[acyl-carrier protein] reductase